MKRAVLLFGKRTPFIKSGTIGPMAASDLVLQLFTGAKYGESSHLDALTPHIDTVIGANIGNILSPDGSNLARIAAVRCGIPRYVPAWTVNMNCASGLHAVQDAIKEVELGLAKCVLVVAAECMDDYPALYKREQGQKLLYLAERAKRTKGWWRKKLSSLALTAVKAITAHHPIALIEIGLTDPLCDMGMHQIAEHIAKTFGISREEQDRYALESHRRAEAHRALIEKEIAPYYDTAHNKTVTHDNGVRTGQTLTALAELKPLEQGSTITAGNSSQVSNGACILVVADEEYAKSEGFEEYIRAEFSSTWSGKAGCDPQLMGLGPVPATRKALEGTGRTMEDIAAVETNEAFASVVLAQMKTFGSFELCKKHGLGPSPGDVVFERTNVHGGAIAIGHPISASGARLVLHMAYNLAPDTLGLVTLCAAGGQGEALIMKGR